MTILAAKLEAAIARLEALPDAHAREAAREALSAVLELHREAIERLSKTVPDLRAAAKDPLVASLFAIHDIPLAPEPGLVPPERLLSRRERRHERCELCAAPVGDGHEHLFDVAAGTLRCACGPCAVLFDGPDAKMRRLRRYVRKLDGFRITDAQWAALEVPVAVAFIFRSSARGQVVAAYPSPAGATQSVVPDSAWEQIARENPALAELEPDVSALLVDRRGPIASYAVASIDECYRLAGEVRTRWRGITGGDEPGRAVQELFDRIEERPA